MYAILGGFYAQKSVCFWGCALATGFSPRSPLLFSAFGLNFWLLGASSPFVTPNFNQKGSVRLRMHQIRFSQPRTLLGSS